MKNYLYLGQFNWYGEIFKVWKHAPNANKAYFLMIKELNQKIEVSAHRLRQYFNGDQDNYRIERKGGKHGENHKESNGGI